MNGLTKGILATLVVGATLLVAAPKQAEARRWVYYSPAIVAAPAPAYSAYYPVYPVYPGRAVYRSYYYSPTIVVPTYPAPYYYYGY